VGNAHGFWGDRIEAAAEMLAAEPDLDYITLDFLAEVSMSILAVQRSRDPSAGWPRDVASVIQSLVNYWSLGGQCRLITNGGGLNPHGCAQACRRILDQAGLNLKIGIVSGDDILDSLKSADPDAPHASNLDTAEPISSVQSRLVTANAYLGARPVCDALARGAHIVITGRVADPSLTVAACAHFHGWQWDDWNRLAGATVAGHLIECGTQVTGGISTDWLDVPNANRIGFPIVEVADDGSFIITKPSGSGGHVCVETVKEQLVYEIGDPGNYLSPDVTVSFLSLRLSEDGPDRIRVDGAQGRPAPSTYKVSATYQDGYRAQGELTIYGAQAVAKALRAGNGVLNRLRSDGYTFRESVVECLGAGACHPGGMNESAATLRETVLRIAVADESREALERFSLELMPLITAGPPGTTGYSAGRPRIQPVFRYWPCLIERDRVFPMLDVIEPGQPFGLPAISVIFDRSSQQQTVIVEPDPAPTRDLEVSTGTLIDIALARSGDKGISANIGVIARNPGDYERLCDEVTVDRVATHLGIDDPGRVTRYEVPNIGALNLIVRGILSNSLRVDAQGKTLGQVLLELPLKARD
jgi:hypothetical protein